MSNQFALRLFKLTVLILTPVLGFVYFSQNSNSLDEEVVPFRSFQAPEVKLLQLDSLSAKSNKDSNFPEVNFEAREPITLVNFWASWCAPCVEEFPAMVELQRQFEGKGFEIVFVSVDEDPQAIFQFMKDNLIDVSQGRLFWDPERKAAAAWGSDKFPESYVLRKDHWVVEKVIGFQRWTRPVVVEYFSDLVNGFQAALYKIWTNTLGSSVAFAEDEAANPAEEVPSLIHEDDKKTLEKLKQNIQTASQNYEKAKAELLKEQRSVNELEISKERQEKQEKDSLENREVIRKKIDEVQNILKKNKEAKKSEESEKKRIQDKIKDLQKEIADLEEKVKSKKTELISKNQELNTRLQNIESLDKAENSSTDELESLLKKEKVADQHYKEQKGETGNVTDDLKGRKKRISKLEKQVEDLNGVLEKAKTKLADFEKILRK